MGFEGKVAIVTGAGQGIGEAYARALAARGAAVVVADINETNAKSVADDISEHGGLALACYVDVADVDSAAALCAATLDSYGRLDHLVNNAAIYGGMRTEPLMTVDLDYYHGFMEVNLNGALIVTRACYRALAADGGGSIVNQSSTAAWMATGYYSVAKAGLNSLTVSLAHELAGRNIRVNAIAPGPTDTGATRSVVPEAFLEPLVQSLAIKRLGKPSDLVGACLFLLSDEASWMTGQIMTVDGGQTVRP
jgi:NAD(P)-dependent dehydrogenase (short-subunit alcohol dehydrogenase family)